MRRKKSTKERFENLYLPEPNTGCWLWIGGTISTGYGSFSINSIAVAAHRISYELHKGAIPVGLQIDHLCKVKMCVNPDHLEAVSRKENMRRAIIQYAPDAGFRSVPGSLFDPAYESKKTHCPKGHPYAGDNLWIGKRKNRPGVNRQCLTCAKERSNQSRSRRQLQAQAEAHQARQAAAPEQSSDSA